MFLTMGKSFLYGVRPELDEEAYYITTCDLRLRNGNDELIIEQDNYFKVSEVPKEFYKQVKGCIHARMAVKYLIQEVQEIVEPIISIDKVTADLIESIQVFSEQKTIDIVSKLLNADLTDSTIVITPDIIDGKVSGSTETLIEAHTVLRELEAIQEDTPTVDTNSNEVIEGEVLCNESVKQNLTKDRILELAKTRKKKSLKDKILQKAKNRRGND